MLINRYLQIRPKTKKAKIRQKKHYIFSKAQTLDYEQKRKISGEKHMKNGLKQGIFDVKRNITARKKTFLGVRGEVGNHGVVQGASPIYIGLAPCTTGIY